MPELGFENRLQNLFYRALNHAVFDGGNAQRAELPWFAGFRYKLSTRGTRLILSCTEFLS
jgi:hypothetical protein